MDLCLQIYEDLWVERPDPGFRFCLIYTHSLSQSIHQTDIFVGLLAGWILLRIMAY